MHVKESCTIKALGLFQLCFLTFSCLCVCMKPHKFEGYFQKECLVLLNSFYFLVPRRPISGRSLGCFDFTHLKIPSFHSDGKDSRNVVIQVFWKKRLIELKRSSLITYLENLFGDILWASGNSSFLHN